jgi:hypothetical protein
MARRTRTKPLIDDSLITSRKAAEIIGCSAQYVNKLVRSGQLQAKKERKGRTVQTSISYGSVLDFVHHRAEPKLSQTSLNDDLLRRITELERRMALVERNMGRTAVVRDRAAYKAASERIRAGVRRLHPEAFT